MGGHAYIIPGELAPALRPDLHPPAASTPAPLWRRLFGSGSSAADVTRVTEMPNGDRFFDIPPGSLGRALVADLRAWLHARLPRPSAGTSVVLDYIKEIEPTVNVRGLQKRGEPNAEFYVQITFSGCAGQAETSSRVASHWTSFWYAAEKDRIASTHLAPFGFTPITPEQGEEEEMMFLPAGQYGCLEYTTPDPNEPVESAFDPDGSVAEVYDGDPVLEHLDAAFGRYMAVPRCRCQICEPDFGDATPDA